MLSQTEFMDSDYFLFMYHYYQKSHLIHSFANVHHFIFIKCRSVSNSLTSARIRFLVSLSLIQIHPTLFHYMCYFLPFLPRHSAFFIPPMLTYSAHVTLPLHSSSFLSLPMNCFPLSRLYVTSRLSLTWSKYMVSAL